MLERGINNKRKTRDVPKANQQSLVDIQHKDEQVSQNKRSKNRNIQLERCYFNPVLKSGRGMYNVNAVLLVNVM